MEPWAFAQGRAVRRTEGSLSGRPAGACFGAIEHQCRPTVLVQEAVLLRRAMAYPCRRRITRRVEGPEPNRRLALASGPMPGPASPTIVVRRFRHVSVADARMVTVSAMSGIRRAGLCG